MKGYRLLILLLLATAWQADAKAQDDKRSLISKEMLPVKKDSAAIPAANEKAAAPALPVKKDTVAKHIPRIATKRSALIPGWGQAYNKEYWKIPLVYGVLAIPAGLYFYNNSYYNKTKFAYEARFKEAKGDPSDVPFIDEQLKNLSISSLQSYRNSFRRDRDYSVLWFLIAWGLQVADATVFAHLKQFDVSNDLSMEISPVIIPQTGTTGLGLTLSLKNPSRRQAITR